MKKFWSYLLSFTLILLLIPAASFAVAAGGEGIAGEETETLPPIEVDAETIDPNADPHEDEEGTNSEEAEEDGVLEQTASPLPTPLSKGRYRIRPAVSDVRLLDIYGKSTTSGAGLQLYQATNETNQLFDVSFDSATGYYTITSVNSGLVLDVSGAKAKSGASVIQYAKTGRTNQQWILTETIDSYGNTAYEVASALASNLVLDVNGGRDVNETKIQVWSKNNKTSQRFYFLPTNPNITSTKTIDDGIYSFASALSSSFVLDIAGASNADGVQLALWTKNGGINQLFQVKYDAADGFYTIRPLCSGKSLDVSKNSSLATTPVLQWAYSGRINQKWAIVDNGDGTKTLIAKNSGLALDIAGGKATTGAKVLMYYPHGGKNQRFILTQASADPLKEGVFTISPYTNGSKVIDISNASRSTGVSAIAYASNSQVNQKFQVERVAPATYTFRSLISGRYLVDTAGNVVQEGGQGAAATTSQQWKVVWVFGGVQLINVSTNRAMILASKATDIKTASPSANDNLQSFRFNTTAPIPVGYYNIVIANGGFAVDLNGGSSVNGANVQLWSINSTNAQKWKLELGSDGYYIIANAFTKKALDIKDAGSTEGTNVFVWAKTGGNNQKWKPIPTNDGYFYLQGRNGTYLRAAGTSGKNGANIYITPTITTALKVKLVATKYSDYQGTYADVNLTTQKMIYVKNGELLVSSDIVSGAPSMRTPTGTYSIRAKQSPSVLVGPGYASPVSYWMPFIGNAIGFHDATWQSSFGGNRWQYSGSHGCINMPLAKAKELYSVISLGDQVRVHY